MPHLRTLLSLDVAATFDQRLKTVGRQLFCYGHSQTSKPKVKACLQEIETVKVDKRSAAPEYESVPLSLLALFNESKDYFYRVIGVNIPTKVNGSAPLLFNIPIPCTIGKISTGSYLAQCWRGHYSFKRVCCNTIKLPMSL